MVVRFALYDKSSGNVFLMLPRGPDNDDYLDSGTVISGQKARAEGVRWENVGIWQNDAGVVLDEGHAWRYDEKSQEFIDDGEVL